MKPLKYKVLLYESEEGFDVSCPALPGCWSRGGTEAEATENIQDAIQEYLAAGTKYLESKTDNSKGTSVTYTLTGKGWSKCFAQIGEHSADVTASYLDDALGDLLRAIVGLMKDVEDTTASFAEEPGEYRWRFRRVAPDKVNIRILQFGELWGYKPDEEGEILLDVTCRLRTFAGAVLSASQRVLEEHGLEGYKAEWVAHDFPLDLQQELKSLLASGG